MLYGYVPTEIIKDGFSFEGRAGSVDPVIIIRENEWVSEIGWRYRAPLRDIESYVEYINQKELKEAVVRVSDLSFLERCPSLKRMTIDPPVGNKGTMDYSPLYRLPQIESLQCIAYYGEFDQYISEVDYSKIRGLVSLGVQVTKGMKNYEKIPTLKSLFLSDFKGRNRDLTDAFCSEQLDILSMIACGIKSLKGLSQSKKMELMDLSYCRSLEDISELRAVKKTLRRLNIENCGKIKDFSVLGELENLETLSLDGNNTIPNLKFLENLKNLKMFSFSVNVEDGDLSPCLKLPAAYCDRGRKHYNLKDSDLPKNKYEPGETDIEAWRQGVFG